MEKRELRVPMDRSRPVGIQVYSSDCDGLFDLDNISRSGMCVNSSHLEDLEIGKSVHFSIEVDNLAQTEVIHGVASVRWIKQGPVSQKPMAGLKVVKFHDDSRQTYLYLLEQRLKRQTVASIMNPSVLCFQNNSPIEQIFDYFMSSQDQLVVMLDGQTPTNILTAKDLLRVNHNEVNGEMVGPEQQLRLVNPNDPLEEICTFFQSGESTPLVVVEDDIFLGVVTVDQILPYWVELTRLQTERLDKTCDDALAVIAHDLQAPIAIIQSANQMLTSEEFSSDQFIEAGLPEIIDQNCQTMTQLIDKLIGGKKVNFQTPELEKKEIDIEAMLDKIYKSFLPLASEKKITLEIDIAAAVPKIEADPLRIEQVLNNLVQNAIKYTASEGQVVFGLRAYHSKVAIWIADNGSGMTHGQIDEILGGENLSESISQDQIPAPKGYGLGLKIVQNLIEAHDGELRIDSVLEEGTTVTIMLPIRELQ